MVVGIEVTIQDGDRGLRKCYRVKKQQIVRNNLLTLVGCRTHIRSTTAEILLFFVIAIILITDVDATFSRRHRTRH